MTRLRWFGHATVRLELDDVQFLFDPFLVGGIGPVRRRRKSRDLEVAPVDAVLVSHAHQDHLHLGSLRQLDRSTTLVVPRNTGRLVRAQGFEKVHEVDAGDELTIGGVRVRTVHAAHDGRRMPFGPDAPAVGYVLDGDERVYFAGDTDLFPGMADLAGDLDLATCRSGAGVRPCGVATSTRRPRRRHCGCFDRAPRSRSTGGPSGRSGWAASGATGSMRVAIASSRKHGHGTRGDGPVLLPGDSFEVPPRPVA